MNIRPSGSNLAQRGMVLVSSLLLLIVVTIIALSMFRSFGIQERITGNVREKQRALQAAVSAQTYAENWLENNSANTAAVTCAAPLLSANIGQGQICSTPNAVTANAISVPWSIGVTYTPPNMQVSATPWSSALNIVSNPTYYGKPTFNISDMGVSVDPTYPGEIYQIDAYGYGGSSNTVAEVESTYVVYTTSKSLMN